MTEEKRSFVGHKSGFDYGAVQSAKRLKAESRTTKSAWVQGSSVPEPSSYWSALSPPWP